MAIRYEAVSVTTHASLGTATAYSGLINGRILGVRYVFTDFAATADLTITGETSEQAILTKADQAQATTWYYPRILDTKNTDGDNLTTYDKINVTGERVKIAVAQAGNSKTCSIGILSDDYETIT